MIDLFLEGQKINQKLIIIKMELITIQQQNNN